MLSFLCSESATVFFSSNAVFQATIAFQLHVSNHLLTARMKAHYGYEAFPSLSHDLQVPIC